MGCGPPKDFHVLIPPTCEHVTLQGKRDFADSGKLRISRWGDDAGLSGWDQRHHVGPNEGGEAGVREGDGTTAAEAAGMLAGKLRNAGSF